MCKLKINVKKVMTLEPSDKNNVPQKKYINNLWAKRVLMKKIAFILSVIILVQLVVVASPFEYEVCNLGWKHVHHEHNEESYQQAWCDAHGGVMEYENSDFTRVDCLTKTHAVEFDFANKWHEHVGWAYLPNIIKMVSMGGLVLTCSR